MDRLTNDQMAKLPKWAQRHVEALQREAEYHRDEKAALFSSDPADVKVALPYFYSANGAKDDNQPLPDRQHVRFYLPHPDPRRRGDVCHVTIGLDDVRGGILVHGSDALGVTPNSANSLSIRPVAI